MISKDISTKTACKIIALTLAGTFIFIMMFMVPQAREYHNTFKAKCNDAGGVVIRLRNNTACIEADAFIEIE